MKRAGAQKKIWQEWEKDRVAFASQHPKLAKILNDRQAREDAGAGGGSGQDTQGETGAMEFSLDQLALFDEILGVPQI